MHCSLLLILFAISCCAQEHLTCMRTSDTLSRLTTPESPQTKGLQGQPGKKGPAGPKGSTGLKGANGDRGFNGSSGPIGPAGPKGSTGLKGANGDRGFNGLSGLIGPAGPKGSTGHKGAKGDRGFNGSAGPMGPAGSNGSSGPIGPAGNKGSNGDRGFKGEPGVVDNAEVDRLRDRVAALELELRTTISALQSSHANLGDGWITPYNGYQYKRTVSHASWQSSRSMCQAMGADLAVHGMQDSRVRLAIVNALSLGSYTWIGLSDIDDEGRWMWIDGTPLTDEIGGHLWRSGEPNNVGSGEDCAVVQVTNAQCFDVPCSRNTYYAICEKVWSP